MLKKARRKRMMSSWVDGVATGSGDIDRFVITRQGGLVAIDSKWRNEVTRARLEKATIAKAEIANRVEQFD